MSWCVALPCRVSPRRAGNFHLRPHVKVTNAKGRNAKPLTCSARCATAPVGPLDAAPALTRTLREARPRVASALGSGFLRGRGLASPPTSAQVLRCAALVPSGPLGRGYNARRTHKGCCIQALCFGDFYLGPLKKVTRRPGRDPAMPHSAPHTPHAQRRAAAVGWHSTSAFEARQRQANATTVLK